MTKAFFCDVLRRKKSLKYLPHFGNTKISYSSSWWSDWSATGPCSPWPTPPRPTPRWLRTSGGTSWPTTRTSSGRWTLWGIWRWRIRARGRCSWQSEIFWEWFDVLKKNVYACLQEGLKWMSLKEYCKFSYSSYDMKYYCIWEREHNCWRFFVKGPSCFFHHGFPMLTCALA